MTPDTFVAFLCSISKRIALAVPKKVSLPSASTKISVDPGTVVNSWTNIVIEAVSLHQLINASTVLIG